jgi:8-oxo-dGTP pyrophosphatase MutT (NUDIX family)
MTKKETGKGKAARKTVEEVSAGGIVRRGDELLLVKVENLKGQVVWTFPKGHIEKGETLEQTAVREVQEETGWLCKITKRFLKVQYYFQREGVLVRKIVHWFLMEPVEVTGKSDPEEIMDTRWVPWSEAAELLVYESDKKIMGKLKEEGK